MQKPLVFGLFFIAVFLEAGTYGLTFMLPNLFENFGANEKDVGQILGITTVSTLVSVYYIGHLTDRIGRMASLSLSGVAIAVSLFLFGMADSLGASIVIASVVLGFGWGVFYALPPVVLTRISDEKERVRVFSLHTVFMMAGFGLSPVLASIMEKRGLPTSQAFFVVAVVCIISAVLFYILRPAIQAMSEGRGAESRSSLTIESVSAVFRSRAIVPLIMVCLGASVFAGMNNFQTEFAEERGLDYANFFLFYTVTVVICRLLLTGFSGGRNPYAVIAALQYIMFASVVLFMFSGSNPSLFILVAILFGVGYGASYPVLVAMAANDADNNYTAHTLQIFAFTYFIGIFGFPLIAGWIIVDISIQFLLVLIAVLALVEASMALKRAIENRSLDS
ncbi:MAG: MFS transporter [Pseudomonadota bacterium]